MKRILVSLAIISLVYNLAFSQTKFVVEPNFSPLLLPFGKLGFSDDSGQIHPFNFKESFSPKYGLSLSFVLNSG